MNTYFGIIVVISTNLCYRVYISYLDRIIANDQMIIVNSVSKPSEVYNLYIILELICAIASRPKNEQPDYVDKLVTEC